MTEHSYKVGNFVAVRFGRGQQLARVEGFTKTGRIKVRCYNGNKGQWMQNLKTVFAHDILAFWSKPIPDLTKGWRVNDRDDSGNAIRNDRGFVVWHWEPLPPI